MYYLLPVANSRVLLSRISHFALCTESCLASIGICILLHAWETLIKFFIWGYTIYASCRVVKLFWKQLWSEKKNYKVNIKQAFLIASSTIICFVRPPTSFHEFYEVSHQSCSQEKNRFCAIFQLFSSFCQHVTG